MTEEKNLKIMEQCVRFKSCSANRCPLDADINLRNYIKGEEVCGVSKNIRLRIGQKFGLKKLGLTEREWAAKKRYEKMSVEERERLIRNGSEALKKLNCGAAQEYQATNDNIVV